MENIKYVAIYLRKSREENNDALNKHKIVLNKIAEDNNWKTDSYEEIVSGDSIDKRPQFQSLLEKIKQKKFDAILVHDYDRLGRGDLADQALIIDAFKNSQTKIITAKPFKIYDLNDELDEQSTDFYHFIARQEYKMIKKRMKMGKEIGAKMGNWVSGKPPYPYDYDKNTKKLIVNEEKYSIYRKIIDMFLNDHPVPYIVKFLNSDENYIKERKWNVQSIYRLLKDETHLGKITYNKSSYHYMQTVDNKVIKENKKRNEWIITDNAHTSVITDKEYEKVIEKLNQLKPGEKNIYPLTGLVKCDVCNKKMSFNRKRHYSLLRACRDKKCNNKGERINVLWGELVFQIEKYLTRLEKLYFDINKDHQAEIEEKIMSIQKEIKNIQSKLKKIYEAYESGVYSLQEFYSRKSPIIEQINELEKKYAYYKKLKNEDYVEKNKQKIRLARTQFELLKDNKLTDEQVNKFLKSFVKVIYWNKQTKDTINLRIRFEM